MKNIKEILQKEKLVAVIRTSSIDKALLTIKACLEGGFKFIEITFTIPDVEKVLQEVDKFKKTYNCIIGAGTVMNINQAKLAYKYQCDFIVSPNFSIDISNFCLEKKLLYIPGAMTINEITTINKQGWDLIKLFPANNFEKNFINTLKGPLPDIEVMPTGGVDLDNFIFWLNGGAFACGIGNHLSNLIEDNDDYKGTIDLARKYIEKVNKWES